MNTEDLILETIEDARRILSNLILEAVRNPDEKNLIKLEKVGAGLQVFLMTFGPKSLENDLKILNTMFGLQKQEGVEYEI